MSRDILADLLLLKRPIPATALARKLHRRYRYAVVLLRGRLLSQDLQRVGEAFLREGCLFGADGAANALEDVYAIRPQILVTDLDSADPRIISEVSREGVTMVHAHGDNIDRLLRIVPKLGRRIFGTTQVSPRGPVANLGGFMDGDRACYAAAHLGFTKIVLLGLDFSSVPSAVAGPLRLRKIQKLAMSRKSLQFLLSSPTKRARFYAPTSTRESLSGLEKLEPSELRQALS